MAQLNGSSTPVEVAPGYTVIAPGLRGQAEARDGRAPGTLRGGVELARPALDQALQAAGVNEIKLIELDVQPVPTGPAQPTVRTAGGDDGLVLEVPDLGDTVGQVILAIDEEGVMTWSFPEDQAGRLETSTSRGAGAKKRFVIRRHVPPPAPPAPGAEPARRSLAGAIGKKLFKVLVFPLVDKVLGPVTEHFAGKWEEARRPYGVRLFGPDGYAAKPTGAAPAMDWGTLARDRALLFIHGTFSTSYGAFGELPRATIEALNQAYGGRVFAFDHFTLSHDPSQNTRWLLSQIPSGSSLRLDVVCHSRGGLVARALAGELGQADAKAKVERIVFVGTPNQGTLLADPEYMGAFLDRITSLLNLIPDSPVSAVADTLEAVITVVKVVGQAALRSLEGLASMRPDGSYLSHAAAAARKGIQCYAIAADFEPKGSLLQLATQTVADQVIDRVFKKDANDLVVPTAGVYADFGLPDDRIYKFPGARGVAHTNYFAQPETAEQIQRWLVG